MGDHNEAASRLIKEMVRSVGAETGPLCTLAESLLLGVGLFTFPGEPRKAAQLIQEIANGAIDRTTQPQEQPRHG